MKQKMVIDVPMSGSKSQTRALKIAVGILGVESVKLGKQEGQLEVIGEGVDPVKVTDMLRKRMEKREIRRCWMGNSVHAELLSLENVEEKKEEKKEEVQPQEAVYVGAVIPHRPIFLYEINGYDDRYPSCSIL